MLLKTTKQLFHGKYQHKVVLVSPAAARFRNQDLETVLDGLKKVDISNVKPSTYGRYGSMLDSQEELDYAIKLTKCLMTLSDFDLRIERPWLSIYTNDKRTVNKLTKLDINHVKYVSSPDTILASGEIVLPKVPFEYKVTLGKTTSSHEAFIEWANANKKLKLTNGCIKDLLRDTSWGGSYFYVTGDNVLLMAKMHLGGSIRKVERIVKKTP